MPRLICVISQILIQYGLAPVTYLCKLNWTDVHSYSNPAGPQNLLFPAYIASVAGDYVLAP